MVIGRWEKLETSYEYTKSTTSLGKKRRCIGGTFIWRGRNAESGLKEEEEKEKKKKENKKEKKTKKKKREGEEEEEEEKTILVEKSDTKKTIQNHVNFFQAN